MAHLAARIILSFHNLIVGGVFTLGNVSSIIETLDSPGTMPFAFGTFTFFGFGVPVAVVSWPAGAVLAVLGYASQAGYFYYFSRPSRKQME